MKPITAYLNSLRIAPRKVRAVADTIKGMTVGDARVALSFRPRVASVPLAKLLKSAVANATHNAGVSNPDSLVITNITVDEGRPLKRFMPRAMGRASAIKKRTSHVSLTLGKKS